MSYALTRDEPTSEPCSEMATAGPHEEPLKIRSPAFALRPIRLAVVDDNDLDRRALSCLFAGSNWPQASVSVHADIAAVIAAERTVRSDLILLDDNLGDGSRAEDSIAAMRAAGISCPVVVCTGLARRNRAGDVLRLGAVHFVDKDDITRESVPRILALGLVAGELWRGAAGARG